MYNLTYCIMIYNTRRIVDKFSCDAFSHSLAVKHHPLRAIELIVLILRSLVGTLQARWRCSHALVCCHICQNATKWFTNQRYPTLTRDRNDLPPTECAKTKLINSRDCSVPGLATSALQSCYCLRTKNRAFALSPAYSFSYYLIC
jgi:hypothetical protein